MVDDRTKESILVVDDSEQTVEVLRRNLESEGYQVATAHSVPDALDVLSRRRVDLVITDVKMPQISGLDLVRHVRDNLKRTEVMVITGYPNVDGAVASLKRGATDYLSKPFTDEELSNAVRQALDRAAMRDATGGEGRPVRRRHGLIGESPAMQRVFAQIDRSARTDAIVLISGESGTGKELVARAIHYESARAAAPFVPVNCGAIPEKLLESELFGHVKGAFTGASESRAGFFLTADGGTIFLDEIGETSPAMQVKLLRVLQEREVVMVGASRARTVDVRIIAATNKNLEQLVRTGAFREDLYFRILVIPIETPPLRDRGADVIALARHFASKFAGDQNRPVPAFSDRVLDIFRSYAWPGNVRELENIVQRLVLMAEDTTIDAPDLPSLMRFSTAGASRDVNRTLAQVEAEHIRDVLASVGGNKTQAARILGIDRKTLRGKLQQYAIDESDTK